MNFVEETLQEIGGKEVKEFYLEFHNLLETSIYTGKSLEDLKRVFSSLKEEQITYDKYNSSIYWLGWISFRDNSWIERNITDTPQMWEFKELPILEKYL